MGVAPNADNNSSSRNVLVGALIGCSSSKHVRLHSSVLRGRGRRALAELPEPLPACCAHQHPVSQYPAGADLTARAPRSPPPLLATTFRCCPSWAQETSKSPQATAARRLLKQ